VLEGKGEGKEEGEGDHAGGLGAKYLAFLNILNIESLPASRLLHERCAAWNGASMRVCGCTGTTVDTILTYFTYTHPHAARC